jgi:hypothetical protein
MGAMGRTPDNFFKRVFQIPFAKKGWTVFKHEGYTVFIDVDEESGAYRAEILVPSREAFVSLFVASPNMKKAEWAVKEWIDRRISNGYDGLEKEKN